MRTKTIFMTVFASVLLLSNIAPATVEATNNKQHRYTICHATSSEKNPYVKITVDYHSIVKKGHDQHQDHGDIIPAIPEHNYAGLNTDKVSIYENDCQPVQSNSPSEPTVPATPEQPATPNKPEQPTKPESKPAKAHKYTICHATSSTKNPYVKITVDYHSIVKKGHDQHQDHGDIIPAIPEHNYAGLNTDKLHILENGCKPVTASEVTLTEPETPGQGGVAPSDEPVIEILDAASTEAPAVASVATTLPQTGAWLSSLIIMLSGMSTAGFAYAGQAVRKFFSKA